MRVSAVENHGGDSLDFLIRRRRHRRSGFSVWNSREMVNDHWSSGEERGANKEREKDNEVKVRRLYVEKEAYPQRNNVVP